MANDATVNPMYVDDNEALVGAGEYTIQAIAWVSDETAGDDIAADDFFELRYGPDAGNTSGVILISKTAKFAGDDLFVSFPRGMKVKNLWCSALDGGICYIYVV
jgi:hypothetical protein